MDKAQDQSKKTPKGDNSTQKNNVLPGRQGSDFFRDLVEENPDLMLCLDLDGAILYANRRARQTFGYRQEELIGADFLALLGADSLEDFSELMDQSSATAAVFSQQITIFDADNQSHQLIARLNRRVEDGQAHALRLTLRPASDTQADIDLQAVSRVLVIEDDPVSARLLQRLLEKGGFDSDHAETAANARAMLKQGDYVAITLDLMLPDQDGLSLLHEFRSHPAYRDLPVIVVSAHADETRDRLVGDSASVVDWLNKPLDAGRLKHALSTLFERNPEHLPHVLHVESDAAFTRQVNQVLGELVTLQHTRTLAGARKLLQDSQDFDLVLLGMTLPDGMGAELLPFLNRPKARPVPVILVSSGEPASDLSAHVADTLTRSLSTQRQLLETIQAHLEPTRRR